MNGIIKLQFLMLDNRYTILSKSVLQYVQ